MTEDDNRAADMAWSAAYTKLYVKATAVVVALLTLGVAVFTASWIVILIAALRSGTWFIACTAVLWTMQVVAFDRAITRSKIRKTLGGAAPHRRYPTLKFWSWWMTGTAARGTLTTVALTAWWPVPAAVAAGVVVWVFPAAFLHIYGTGWLDPQRWKLLNDMMEPRPAGGLPSPEM